MDWIGDYHAFYHPGRYLANEGFQEKQPLMFKKYSLLFFIVFS